MIRMTRAAASPTLPRSRELSCVALICLLLACTAAQTPAVSGGQAAPEASDPAAASADARPGSAAGTSKGRTPLVVTSSRDSYFQVSAASATASETPATLRIDPAAPLQEWLGFGGTFNEAGWDALGVLPASERLRALHLLFDAKDGAHLRYGRIPIGASDFALDRYTLAEVPDDWTLEHFSVARDERQLIPYIQAALTVAPDLHLWASPWTPPAWMKTNGSTDGGRLRNEPAILRTYALYFARFAEEYAKRGIPIRAIHPQNEPGYEQTYPTCLWAPELMRDFVGHYLGPTLRERGVNADIWLGTLSAPEDAKHIPAVMEDTTAAPFIHGLGVQWNTMGAVADFTARYHLPAMQTEHRCGNYPWIKEKFSPKQAPNDHAYAEESWGLITRWVRAGVNAYSAWNMVLDTIGMNLDVGRPWPQNALLVVDREHHSLSVTPVYWLFRHLSQFVDEGAHRLTTDGTADALAFQNPDGSIVTIIHQPADTPLPVTLGMPSSTVAVTVPPHGWTTVIWQ
jgi:glucosylceramidase